MKNKKYLAIETDYPPSDTEQINTRISAFLELIQYTDERKQSSHPFLPTYLTARNGCENLDVRQYR